MTEHPRMTVGITFAIALAALIATVLLATFGTRQASISLLPDQDTEAPRLHPSEATKAWALDAIHRRTTEDTRLRLRAPVMKADWSTWIRAADGAAVARAWYPHDMNRWRPGSAGRATMTMLVPEDQLDEAALIADDPYDWLQQNHTAAAGSAVPAFVEITLRHPNHGHTMQKLAGIYGVLSLAAFIFGAVALIFLVATPAEPRRAAQ